MMQHSCSCIFQLVCQPSLLPVPCSCHHFGLGQGNFTFKVLLLRAGNYGSGSGTGTGMGTGGGIASDIPGTWAHALLRCPECACAALLTEIRLVTILL